MKDIVKLAKFQFERVKHKCYFTVAEQLLPTYAYWYQRQK